MNEELTMEMKETTDLEVSTNDVDVLETDLEVSNSESKGGLLIGLGIAGAVIGAGIWGYRYLKKKKAERKEKESKTVEEDVDVEIIDLDSEELIDDSNESKK